MVRTGWFPMEVSPASDFGFLIQGEPSVPSEFVFDDDGGPPPSPDPNRDCHICVINANLAPAPGSDLTLVAERVEIEGNSTRLEATGGVVQLAAASPGTDGAIRTERYRMVEWTKSKSPTEYELYDYQEDPNETANLATKKPKVLAEMKTILAKYPPPVPRGGKPRTRQN